MSDRTICQMEVHPELIRLHRERTALFKKWHEIYGKNPFQNAYPANLQGQMQADTWLSALLGGLMGDVGSRGIGIARVDWKDWYQQQ